MGRVGMVLDLVAEFVMGRVWYRPRGPGILQNTNFVIIDDNDVINHMGPDIRHFPRFPNIF